MFYCLKHKLEMFFILNVSFLYSQCSRYVIYPCRDTESYLLFTRFMVSGVAKLSKLGFMPFKIRRRKIHKLFFRYQTICLYYSLILILEEWNPLTNPIQIAIKRPFRWNFSEPQLSEKLFWIN